MSSNPVYVSLEFTPNPNTLKYSVNRKLIESGGAYFKNLKEAEAKSPLAAKLMAVSGIAAVMIGRDFVTVTKSEEGDWDQVHKTASQIIDEHLTKEEPVFLEGVLGDSSAEGSTDVERKIIAIIENDIRPAVAMDGGDILFDRYEDGVVYLMLQGSCSGCPSAAMTLKAGIETRLKEAVPEIKEVVSVA